MTVEAAQRDLVVAMDQGGADDPTPLLDADRRLVWIEPDAAVCVRLRHRLAAEIADGRLRILHCAAGGIEAAAATRMADGPGVGTDSGVTRVLTWADVQIAVGTPARLLIRRADDLVGFLQSMFTTYARPPAITLLCEDATPVNILTQLGLRSFRAARIAGPPGRDWSKAPDPAAIWLAAADIIPALSPADATSRGSGHATFRLDARVFDPSGT